MPEAGPRATFPYPLVETVLDNGGTMLDDNVTLDLQVEAEKSEEAPAAVKK